MNLAPIYPLTCTDAYKLDHRRQYSLAGTVSRVYSNYTNRKSRIAGMDSVIHFGLQAHIQKNFIDAWVPFFEADEDLVASLYEEFTTKVLGPNDIGSDHIRELHRVGYLPIEVRAVAEGTLVPIRIPSFTIENTLDSAFWLTNYLETGISASIWAPSTSATIAHAYRKLLIDRARTTGTPAEAVDFQLHDFSYRGMSSHESAAASAAGHLLSFKGSDSLVAMDWIDRYYGGDYDLLSVAATEHSVMSTGIMSQAKLWEGRLSTPDRGDAERMLFRKLLDLYPTGILSVVSDTFDLWKVLEYILPELKSQVLAREGKLVIRPDSGDPEKIICGNPAGRTEAEKKGVVQLLWDTFGGTTTDTGHRMLDEHIGAIYGDSITLDRADKITARLAQNGFASGNIVFGVGSFTYQYNTRDTFGSAMKATWAKVNGEGVNLFKDPITDDGTKKSATGRLSVLPYEGGMRLQEKATESEESFSMLRPVWKDGEFLRHQSFADVREVLAKQVG